MSAPQRVPRGSCLVHSGISSAYGGPLSALEIQYSLTPSTDDASLGTPTSKLVEREIVTALYEQSKQVLVRKEWTINIPASI